MSKYVQLFENILSEETFSSIEFKHDIVEAFFALIYYKINAAGFDYFKQNYLNKRYGAIYFIYPNDLLNLCRYNQDTINPKLLEVVPLFKSFIFILAYESDGKAHAYYEPHKISRDGVIVVYLKNNKNVEYPEFKNPYLFDKYKTEEEVYKHISNMSDKDFVSSIKHELVHFADSILRNFNSISNRKSLILNKKINKYNSKHTDDDIIDDETKEELLWMQSDDEQHEKVYEIIQLLKDVPIEKLNFNNIRAFWYSFLHNIPEQNERKLTNIKSFIYNLDKKSLRKLSNKIYSILKNR